MGGCPARLWGINNCYYYWYGAFKNACRQEREKRRGERESNCTLHAQTKHVHVFFFFEGKACTCLQFRGPEIIQ